jgi:hypothetical protein
MYLSKYLPRTPGPRSSRRYSGRISLDLLMVHKLLLGNLLDCKALLGWLNPCISREAPSDANGGMRYAFPPLRAGSQAQLGNQRKNSPPNHLYGVGGGGRGFRPWLLPQDHFTSPPPAGPILPGSFSGPGGNPGWPGWCGGRFPPGRSARIHRRTRRSPAPGPPPPWPPG